MFLFFKIRALATKKYGALLTKNRLVAKNFPKWYRCGVTNWRIYTTVQNCGLFWRILFAKEYSLQKNAAEESRFEWFTWLGAQDNCLGLFWQAMWACLSKNRALCKKLQWSHELSPYTSMCRRLMGLFWRRIWVLLTKSRALCRRELRWSHELSHAFLLQRALLLVEWTHIVREKKPIYLLHLWVTSWVMHTTRCWEQMGFFWRAIWSHFTWYWVATMSRLLIIKCFCCRI